MQILRRFRDFRGGPLLDQYSVVSAYHRSASAGVIIVSFAGALPPPARWLALERGSVAHCARPPVSLPSTLALCPLPLSRADPHAQ